VSDAGFQAPEGYLPMAQTQARLGVSKPTLQRMVRAGRLMVYEDARNRRIRLARAEDVAAPMQPRPANLVAA
jgi:excisionase family DNA binding protein